jgi:hypothetical protein
MTEDESGAVHAQLMIYQLGERQVWRWAVGDCAVQLSFPAFDEDSDEFEDAHRDLDFLVYHLPELVESGMQEAQVQIAVQELEKELDEL